MKERLAFHCRTLKTLDWKDDNMTTPTTAMNSLIKETTTLHKVLSQLLTQEQLKSVFEDIFTMINTKIPELFANFNVPTVNGKKRIMQDFEAFINSLENLKIGSSINNSGILEFFEKLGSEKKI